MMRAWFASALLLPLALASCPAVLSDWALGTGATDAASDATNPKVTGGGSSSGDESGSGSSSGANSGSPSSGSLSGLSSGSSSGRADAGLAPEEATTHVAEPDAGVDAEGPDAAADSATGAESGDVGGCALVTHVNGLGQAWQDCAPLGTFDMVEAMNACQASAAAICYSVQNCRGLTVCGEVQNNPPNTDPVVGCWGYQGVVTGHVGVGDHCPDTPDAAESAWK